MNNAVSVLRQDRITKAAWARKKTVKFPRGNSTDVYVPLLCCKSNYPGLSLLQTHNESSCVWSCPVPGGQVESLILNRLKWFSCYLWASRFVADSKQRRLRLSNFYAAEDRNSDVAMVQQERVLEYRFYWLSPVVAMSLSGLFHVVTSPRCWIKLSLISTCTSCTYLYYCK